MLLSWQLPENVVIAVRWHLQPEQVTEEPFVVDLVHVARLLAAQCGIGLGQDGLQYKLSDIARERLKLTDDVTDRAAEGMVNAFQEIRNQFG
jgi:HD-like signal output (HDOD) protein